MRAARVNHLLLSELVVRNVRLEDLLGEDVSVTHCNIHRRGLFL